jgi:hypothetical protein
LEWIHSQLAEDHVMLMGARTYRLMSEIVATGEDPTFPPVGGAAQDRVLHLQDLEAAAEVGQHHGHGPLGLVDRVRVMVFPTIRGETGQEPIFADLPDLDLRPVLLDYRVAERPGDGRG